MSISRQALLSTLPPIWPNGLLPQIQAQLQTNGPKLIILDDDPLGTQTVYDLPIVTDWSTATLRAELADSAPACFVLTNSRSMPAAEAERVYEEIGRSLAQLEAETGQSCQLLTRCDSTLRGHFPGEVAAVQRGWQRPFDAILFTPYFEAGGRLTINDVHYVTDDEQLIPVGETTYARDAVFSYRASNLREWVAEKGNGRFLPPHIHSLSLTDIRQGGPDRIANRLQQLSHGAVCIVNAAHPRDLEVFVLGLLQAEAQGKQFLYRTAASFIQTRLGLAPRPCLSPAELNLSPAGGGLIVVGSHVRQTTNQLEALLASPDIHSTEVSVAALLAAPQPEIGRVAQHIESGLRRQQDVVIYTSRQLQQTADTAHAVQIGRRISEGLVAIMQLLTQRPRYILAKGGITASDLATRALGVRRARVLGQLLPGVPVWQLGSESRFPTLPYIVFPGNVGDTQALATAVASLKQNSVS